MKLQRFYTILSVFVVSLLPHLSIIAGTNTLILQDVTMQNGGSAFLSFRLENDNPITGFQCDLYLPAGMLLDNHKYILGRTNTNQHGITTREMEDGAIRIVCASANSTTFTGNDGAVLLFSVNNTLKPGLYEMFLKNIILTDPDATRYVSEEIASKITILDSNKLELLDIALPNDDSGHSLPIFMNNESQITGFQCDLYLPNSFEFVRNEDGAFQISLGRTTSVEHNVIAHLMEDGGLRIVCSSKNGATFTGNRGMVLSMWIKCNQIVGNYEVLLKNIILTNPDAARITTNDVSCIICAEDPDAIKDMISSEEVSEVDRYDLQGRKLTAPHKGINIIRYSDGTSGKVLVK